MKVLVAGAVACAIAFLLYLSLDSGCYSEPTPRAFSLPLGGLALIFAARAWTISVSRDMRMASFFAGLSLGVGGYALARLFLAG